MKKLKIGLTVGKKYANYLISIIWFAKTTKCVTSGREKYYYSLLPNKK